MMKYQDLSWNGAGGTSGKEAGPGLFPGPPIQINFDYASFRVTVRFVV